MVKGMKDVRPMDMYGLGISGDGYAKTEGDGVSAIEGFGV